MTRLHAPRSTTASLLSSTLLAATALCTSIATTSVAAAATPPPELAPLLQKTSELQIGGERFSDHLTITG